MECPEDIAKVLVKIIHTGILRMRCFAQSESPDRCFLEADHLHNIPTILESYSPDLIAHYWSIERPSYIQQLEEKTVQFDHCWNELSRLIVLHDIDLN